MVGPCTVVVVVVVVSLLLELGPAGESGMEGNGSVLLLLTALMRRDPGRDEAIVIVPEAQYIQIFSV
jgi:hypothetical protein